MLGINLGRVGFLAEADPDQLDGVIQAVIDRSYTVRERMTVDVLVERDGVEITRNWALNEVSVEKATRGTHSRRRRRGRRRRHLGLRL